MPLAFPTKALLESTHFRAECKANLFAFPKNRPFSKMPILWAKSNGNPFHIFQKWPLSKVPIFGQNVRSTPLLFSKKGAFRKCRFLRQKERLTPLQQLAILENTHFWVECKVDSFAFLQELALSKNADLWSKR